jgi:hypothetical protein
MFAKCEVFRVARTNPLRTAVAAIKASGRAVPQSRAISPGNGAIYICDAKEIKKTADFRGLL